jgi:hypothetical protein
VEGRHLPGRLRHRDDHHARLARQENRPSHASSWATRMLSKPEPGRHAAAKAPGTLRRGGHDAVPLRWRADADAVGTVRESDPRDPVSHRAQLRGLRTRPHDHPKTEDGGADRGIDGMAHGSPTARGAEEPSPSTPNAVLDTDYMSLVQWSRARIGCRFSKEFDRSKPRTWPRPLSPMKSEPGAGWQSRRKPERSFRRSRRTPGSEGTLTTTGRSSSSISIKTRPMSTRSFVACESGGPVVLVHFSTNNEPTPSHF